MPRRDGLDLLKSFSARGLVPFVIFVTAYSDYAVNAYDAGAVDYLLKPYDDARFAKALARAKAALGLDRITDGIGADDPPAASLNPRPVPDRLLVSEDHQTLSIPTEQIEFVQVVGRHVKVFVRQRCYLTRQSLRGVEARLDKRYFVRVHRSTIINVEQVVALHPLKHGDCELVLQRGTRITVSRRFRVRLQPFLASCHGLREPNRPTQDNSPN